MDYPRYRREGLPVTSSLGGGAGGASRQKPQNRYKPNVSPGQAIARLPE